MYTMNQPMFIVSYQEESIRIPEKDSNTVIRVSFSLILPLRAEDFT